MSAVKEKFRGLLQHPYEPLFLPKSDGSLIYSLPENFYTDRYRVIGPNLANRFGANSLRSQPVTGGAVPSVVLLGDVADIDLSFADAIPRNGAFSLFIPHHADVAAELIDLFMAQPGANRLGDVAAYVRDRLNGPLFQYALSVALLHHPDTTDVPVPSFLHLFPDQFIDASLFPRMREEGRAVLEENRMALDMPMNFTSSDEEPEQRMDYFREDIGVNLHHWHWHMVNPGNGPLSIVQKDRRGELFYYMHNQVVNRYKIDRLSQGLPRLQNINSLRQMIAEGYSPKIIRSANNRLYPTRYPNMSLSDINRPNDRLTLTISEVEREIIRIVEAIDRGFVINQRSQQVSLDNIRGIDVLGNLVESSALSVNRNLYGNPHNGGHLLIAFIHDPTGRFLEGYGVMADVTTAMRDPVFYRWHGYLDDVFRRHKERFAPYSVAELSFPNISLLGFETQDERQNGPINNLFTFWQRSQVDLGTGLDFGPQGSVLTTFTHLQYAPFNFRLRVSNPGASRRGTVRIFLAPKVDERGVSMTFDEQRRTAIELDKFRVLLQTGINNIVRRSADSSVTIPYERTFRNVSQSSFDEAFRFCTCGWPSHMLLPKGSPEGVNYDLFAMVSNYEQDAVAVEYDETVNCDDAHSYCGLRNRIYPDARSMGYPFDRRLPNNVNTFMDFIAPYQNMRVTTVTIRFTNTVINRT